MVSHDLRAPLRHITSYGKLVREVLGDLPADVLQSPALQEAQEFVGTMEHRSAAWRRCWTGCWLCRAWAAHAACSRWHWPPR